MLKCVNAIFSGLACCSITLRCALCFVVFGLAGLRSSWGAILQSASLNQGSLPLTVYASASWQTVSAVASQSWQLMPTPDGALVFQGVIAGNGSLHANTDGAGNWSWIEILVTENGGGVFRVDIESSKRNMGVLRIGGTMVKTVTASYTFYVHGIPSGGSNSTSWDAAGVDYANKTINGVSVACPTMTLTPVLIGPSTQNYAPVTDDLADDGTGDRSGGPATQAQSLTQPFSTLMEGVTTAPADLEDGSSYAAILSQFIKVSKREGGDAVFGTIAQCINAVGDGAAAVKAWWDDYMETETIRAVLNYVLYLLVSWYFFKRLVGFVQGLASGGAAGAMA